MIDFDELTSEERLRWELALARYLIHFKKHFPELEVYAWEEITRDTLSELEAAVDKCIKTNTLYETNIPSGAIF